MYQLLSILQKSPLVHDIKIIKFTVEEDIQRVYLQVLIKDASSLYIRETRTAGFEDYSYHWQTGNKKLLARWDNAGHYKDLETFPHHLHIKGRRSVFPSKRPDIQVVLDYIGEILKTGKVVYKK